MKKILKIPYLQHEFVALNAYPFQKLDLLFCLQDGCDPVDVQKLPEYLERCKGSDSLCSVINNCTLPLPGMYLKNDIIKIFNILKVE